MFSHVTDAELGPTLFETMDTQYHRIITVTTNMQNDPYATGRVQESSINFWINYRFIHVCCTLVVSKWQLTWMANPFTLTKLEEEDEEREF